MVLTDKEAAEYTETLRAALEDDFDALDKYLWGRQRLYTPEDANDAPVWSDMTEKEIDTLVRVMIKAGRHNPAMATVVRGVVDSRDYIGIASIMVPRTRTSVKIMRETHRRPLRRVERAKQ